MTSTPEPSPPKVFISYAWKNQPVARQLQRDLQRDGVEVFVDYEKITGGDSLPERISTALDWCNTLILLWSADSAESYYVKQEWTSAFHLQKRIIACVLDGTALPALLRGRLYLNFSPYESGYGQLCRSLRVVPKVNVAKAVPPEPWPPTSPTPIIQPQPPHVSPQISPANQTPSPAEVRENPPPATQKPELISAKPSKKTKRWQPLVSKTKVFMPSGSAAARRVSAWWPRGKVMNITFAVIIVAIVVMFYKMCQQSQLDSMEQEKKDALKPATSGPKLRLRSTGIMLSIDSMEVMLRKFDFYHANYTNWIMTVGWSNPQGKGIENQFELSQDKKVIFDRTTGLIWQRSGSSELTTYPRAERYVRELNNQRFADCGDWRLPTLEEAMSLMEPQKSSRLYIDLNFDRTQVKIWTADKQSTSRAWVVYFNDGVCFYDDFVEYHLEYKSAKYYVRAVRSEQ